MAVPNTRDGLKDYCLRALGFGVIDINVSDAQVEAVSYTHLTLPTSDLV